MTGTSNLLNHDFFIVQNRIWYEVGGFHLVYVDVTMVIWRDLVLRTVANKLYLQFFNILAVI